MFFTYSFSGLISLFRSNFSSTTSPLSPMVFLLIRWNFTIQSSSLFSKTVTVSLKTMLVRSFFLEYVFSLSSSTLRNGELGEIFSTSAIMDGGEEEIFSISKTLSVCLTEKDSIMNILGGRCGGKQFRFTFYGYFGFTKISVSW